MQRRAFLIGLFGAFAGITASSLAAPSAGQAGVDPAPATAAGNPGAMADLDRLRLDYMRRRRRRRRRRHRHHRRYRRLRSHHRLRRRHGRPWDRLRHHYGRRRDRRRIRSAADPRPAPVRRPAPASRPRLRFD
jgi:hypothetical protein